MPIFGIPNLSLIYIRDLLKYTKYSYSIYDKTGLKLDKDIIIFSKAIDVINNKKHLYNYEGNIFIFDQPDKLLQFKNIIYFESPSQYVNYLLSTEDILDILKRYNKIEHKIVIQKLDLINDTIKKEQKGRILHIFTKFIYSFPKIKRAEIRKLIVNLLFKTITRKVYDELILKLMKEKNKSYYVDLIAFIDNESKALVAALSAAKHKKFKDELYENIAKEYSVDPYELQFLSKLFITSNSEVKKHVQEI